MLIICSCKISLFKIMRTIVIDILNEKAVALLKNLESLQLIRLRSDQPKSEIKWSDYKGAMTKQPLTEIDDQLSNLRDSWE